MKNKRAETIKTLSKNKGTVIRSYAIDTDLDHEFITHCADNGLNKSFLIRELIKDYLKKV